MKNEDGDQCAKASISRAYLIQIKLEPENFMQANVVELEVIFPTVKKSSQSEF